MYCEISQHSEQGKDCVDHESSHGERDLTV